MSNEINFDALEQLAKKHDLPINSELTAKAKGARPSSKSGAVQLPEINRVKSSKLPTRSSSTKEDFDPMRIITSQVESSPLPTMDSRNILFYLLLKKQSHGRN